MRALQPRFISAGRLRDNRHTLVLHGMLCQINNLHNCLKLWCLTVENSIQLQNKYKTLSGIYLNKTRVSGGS